MASCCAARVRFDAGSYLLDATRRTSLEETSLEHLDTSAGEEDVCGAARNRSRSPVCRRRAGDYAGERDDSRVS